MIDTAAVLSALGQRARKNVTPAEAARALVRRGMPASALVKLAKQLGITLAELEAIVGIPPATSARKRATNDTLKPVLSDRAFRIAHVLTFATEVLETREKAASWLRAPNRALRGEAPLMMLDTEIGSREVEQVLGRIETGVYS
jgi:putative toxin-antitoxin system antitoxin component (TIGR02293 family)